MFKIAPRLPTVEAGTASGDADRTAEADITPMTLFTA